MMAIDKVDSEFLRKGSMGIFVAVEVLLLGLIVSLWAAVSNVPATDGGIRFCLVWSSLLDLSFLSFSAFLFLKGFQKQPFYTYGIFIGSYFFIIALCLLQAALLGNLIQIYSTDSSAITAALIFSSLVFSLGMLNIPGFHMFKDDLAERIARSASSRKEAVANSKEVPKEDQGAASA